MRTKHRVEKLNLAAKRALQLEWALFWAHFSDEELELLAGDPSNDPAYLAVSEKAQRLGGEDLLKRSNTLGLTVRETVYHTK